MKSFKSSFGRKTVALIITVREKRVGGQLRCGVASLIIRLISTNINELTASQLVLSPHIVTLQTVS